MQRSKGDTSIGMWCIDLVMQSYIENRKHIMHARGVRPSHAGQGRWDVRAVIIDTRHEEAMHVLVYHFPVN